MDRIKYFFQMLAAWTFWHDLFDGFVWLDWVLFVSVFVAVIIGIYRGFGFFLPKLIYLLAMTLCVVLVYPWFADFAVRYLTFAKAGFWNPVFFILVLTVVFFIFKKISSLRSKKNTPHFHPFWDRVIGSASGFFFALLLLSFVSQFFLLLPSKSIKSLYSSRGSRYGVVLKQFVPQVLNSALAPVRLLVNRKN